MRIAISEKPVGVTPVTWFYHEALATINPLRDGWQKVWVQRIGGRKLQRTDRGEWADTDPSTPNGNFETFFASLAAGLITVSPNPGVYHSEVFYLALVP